MTVGTAACNSLFYFPSQAVYDVPKYPHRDVRIIAEDDVHLHGWHFPALSSPPRALVLQFHGNAGNVSSHHRSLSWVVEHGHSMVTFDYRGYGQSDLTRPSRVGLHRDAVAALEHVFVKWPELPVIVYGQSLGGAVALRALAEVDRRAVAGIVVEGSFHSYQDVAASVLWRSRLGLPLTGLAYALVTDTLAPAPVIAGLSPTPLLVVHGEDDPVVSYELGLAIYHLAGEPKEFWGIPGGGHVDLSQREGGAYRSLLLAWIDRALAVHSGDGESGIVADGTQTPRSQVEAGSQAVKQVPQ
jgi:uncharacterized protein